MKNTLELIALKAIMLQASTGAQPSRAEWPPDPASLAVSVEAPENGKHRRCRRAAEEYYCNVMISRGAAHRAVRRILRGRGGQVWKVFNIHGIIPEPSKTMAVGRHYWIDYDNNYALNTPGVQEKPLMPRIGPHRLRGHTL